MNFVDLHCHPLPALDDGARSLGESLEMLALLGKLGFSTVCATPHQRFGMFMPDRAAIDGAYDEVRRALAGDGKDEPELLLGAENMWDEAFLARSLDGTLPAYTGGKAFLVELPVQTMPPRVEERLFAIRCAPGRLLPVLAHPERYPVLWPEKGNDPDRVLRLRDQSALVVDLGALDGAHGVKQCKAARFFVEEGLAHAAASDCHQPSDVRFAAAGIAWIRKRLGGGAVTRLLVDGPRQILNGELPD